LLKDYGYEFYIHQRPEKEVLILPDNLYNWQGSDGTIIPAYRIEIGLYHTERTNIQQRISEGVELALIKDRDVAVFWGLGNHGGGATREDLGKIDECISEESRVDIEHSTTDRFFESLKTHIPSAPVYDGELQRVFAGTYTSMARLKRKAIQASAAAEQMGNLVKYGEERSREQSFKDHLSEKISLIWKDILFNDFHDILTGTCTRIAEEDAMDLFGRAMENVREVNLDMITRINRSAKSYKAHIPLSLFCSDLALSKFPVEFECMSDHRPFWDEERDLVLTDENGKEVACQEEPPDALLPFHRWRRKVVFMADKLREGVNYFGLNPVPARDPGNTIMMPFTGDYRIKFRIVEDKADSWGTDTWKWDEAIGEFNEVADSKRHISHGEIRTIQESELVGGRNNIILQQISYVGWPITEYRIRLNWNEEYKRLKLIIPLDPGINTCKCEIPGGVIIRKPDGQEHCHGTWMQLTENQEAGGINIAHNGLHGYDFVQGELRLSVLRSAAYCHWHEYPLHESDSEGNIIKVGPSPMYMDQGIHDIRLAIWRIGKESPAPEAISAWLNAPPLVYPHLPVG